MQHEAVALNSHLPNNFLFLILFCISYFFCLGDVLESDIRGLNNEKYHEVAKRYKFFCLQEEKEIQYDH